MGKPWGNALELPHLVSGPTPPSGAVSLFVKSDGKVYVRQPAASEAAVIVEGDARLSDARTPTVHGHALSDANITGPLSIEKLVPGTIGDNALVNGNLTDAAAVGVSNADPALIASGYRKSSDNFTGTHGTFTIGNGAAGVAGVGKSLMIDKVNLADGMWFYTPPVRVNPGEVWYWSFRVGLNTAAASGLYYRATFYTKPDPATYNDGLISDAGIGKEDFGAPAGWTLHEGQVTVPAGAAYMIFRPHAWVNSPIDGVYYSDMTARKVQVTASIADGAITPPKIAFGAATTEKLTVASLGDSLILNGGAQEAQAADSTRPAQWLDASSGGRIHREANVPASGGAWFVLDSPANPSYSRAMSHWFPVNGGETYVLSCIAAYTTGPTRFYFGIGFNTALTDPGLTSGIEGDAGRYDIRANYSSLPVYTGGPSTWERVEGQITTPDGARWARVIAYNWQPGSQSYIVMDDIRVRKLATSAVIADGAVTLSKISATGTKDATTFLRGDNTWAVPGAAPAGAIMMYGGSTAPAGYLLCDGAAVSRTTYSGLFGVLGTVWGAGDGSTTFNLPDLRVRLPIGVGTGKALGASDGVAEASRNANHAHSHAHSASTSVSVGSAGAHGHTASSGTTGAHGHTASSGTTGAHNHTGSTGSTGSAHTHDSGSLSTGSVADRAAGSLGRATTAISGNTGQTGSAHTHNVPSAGDHAHTVSVSATEGDHAHTVSVSATEGDHAHAASGSTSVGSAGSADHPFAAVNYIVKT